MQINKLSTTAEGTEATIILYGDIGKSWMQDSEEPQNTDKEFLKAFLQLDGKYSRINLRINSLGGSMFDGNAIITAVRNAKSEIHAYNDGVCASMAADLWLACPHRHMATNSLLMIHAPWSMTVGNSVEHRRQADVLDKFAETAINVMSEATGMDKDELKKTYYDGADHWLTHEEATNAGLVNGCGCGCGNCGDNKEDDELMSVPLQENYQSAFKLPAGIAQMRYTDVCKTLKYLPAEVVVLADSDNTTSATAAPSDHTPTPTHTTETQNEEIVNIENIKTALEQGTVTAEQLTALLAPPATAPAPAPVAQATGDEEETEIMKMFKAQQSEIKALSDKLQMYQNTKPGDTPSRTPLPTSTDDTTDAVLLQFRKDMQEAAARGSLNIQRG